VAAAVLAWLERLSPTRQALFLAVATVLCLVPFVAKPLHIDDPLFYWAARHIAAHPLDPYGFKVNWYVVEESMAAVTQNPPGASYYMALVGAVFGWSPTALHLGFLLPAVGVVIAIWALGRRLCRRPVLAGLLVLTAPGFLASATTLMADVPMLALWLAAVLLWIDGVDRDRTDLLVVSSVVAGVCVLTKYPGAAVIPLGVLYALLRRGVGRWMIALLPSLAIVVLYQYWSSGLYGHDHLSDALSYARQESDTLSAHRGLVALSSLGGSFIAAGALSMLVLGRRDLTIPVAVGVAATAYLLIDGHRWWQRGGEAKDWGIIALHFFAFVTSGVTVLLLALRSGWKGDAVALLLACWIVGIEVFAGYINWVVNVRSILPAVPAAALVMTRAIDERMGDRAERVVPIVLVASLAIALWVGLGDSGVARAQVQAAERIVERSAGRSGALWFQGHWGFQVAMEAVGGRPTDALASRFFPGDVLVIPRDNTNTIELPSSVPTRRERIEVPIRLGATTVCNRCGAGFYSSQWGPLPYRVDPPPPQRYDVFHILGQSPVSP
jgi:4-amino-4-deoxy-L-arabinose transferase-like glycosyltransferase